MSLRGMGNVMNNLKAEIEKVKGKALRALVKGAILIRRDMDYKSPLIPVDLGNMRASFFTVTSRGGLMSGGVGPGGAAKFDDKRGDAGKLTSGHSASIATHGARITGPEPRVCLGFSAYYTVIVHEMTGQINWSRPGSGAKFFQSAFRNNQSKIKALIKKEIKI